MSSSQVTFKSPGALEAQTCRPADSVHLQQLRERERSRESEAGLSKWGPAVLWYSKALGRHRISVNILWWDTSPALFILDINLAIRFHKHLLNICAASDHVQGQGQYSNTLLQFQSFQSTVHHPGQTLRYQTVQISVPHFHFTNGTAENLEGWVTYLRSHSYQIEVLGPKAMGLILYLMLYFTISPYFFHIAVWHWIRRCFRPLVHARRDITFLVYNSLLLMPWRRWITGFML
jgi:hypothetical protein